MGGQLSSAKNGTQQQQPPSNYQSLRSSPVRRPLSSSLRSRDQTISSHIVVVNRGPNNDNSQQADSKFLPSLIVEPLIKPLVPFAQSVSLNSDQPRLNPQPIIEIGRLLDQNFRFAAETVASEQQKIVDQIRVVEQQTTKIGQIYCVDKQRRFNKAVENFAKFDDIQTLLDRCESDIEQLLITFAKLNSALPESLCLENFQPPC